MKQALTIMMFCGVISGYAQETPPHAASTQTWVFGSQTWSDAIQIPECNKADFDGGTTDEPKADCFSKTHREEDTGYSDYIGQKYEYDTHKKDRTYYSYSWPYVSQNAALLCPAPWRVPSKQDYIDLSHVANPVTLSDEWGKGTIKGKMTITFPEPLEWTSTGDEHNVAYYFIYDRNFDIMDTSAGSQVHGLIVRCVK
jgi:hypothetical protein